MTKEIELNSEKYGEIAGLLYKKDPKIIKIEKIVLKHLENVHEFGNLLSIEKLYSEIEHIDAIVAGRRNLDELT